RSLGGQEGRAMPDALRIFISYSHDSEEHRERVRQLADRLRNDGVDAWFDQYSPPPVMGWPRWVMAELNQARFVVIVCSSGYRERFSSGPGRGGSGVGWEALLICQEIYDTGVNERFIPVFFDTDGRSVPKVLRPFPRYHLPDQYEAL